MIQYYITTMLQKESQFAERCTTLDSIYLLIYSTNVVLFVINWYFEPLK